MARALKRHAAVLTPRAVAVPTYPASPSPGRVMGRLLLESIVSSPDPLFWFHRWQANLRILEIDELKSVPFVPRSHPFIERLSGTLRREYLDQTIFWNGLDLHRKLDRFV